MQGNAGNIEEETKGRYGEGGRHSMQGNAGNVEEQTKGRYGEAP